MLKTIIDNGVNSDGYKYIRVIFEEVGLAHMFDYFYKNNSGRDNSYHNNTHTFVVVDLVNSYCFREHIGGQLRNVLLIAALYHDFCHSGGKAENDAENISVAFKGLWEGWLKVDRGDLKNRDKTRILPLHMETIRQLIEYTEYPYKDCPNDLFRAIREADILSYEHEEWYKYVFEGLCAECNINIEEKGKDKALLELLEFHSNLLNKEIQTPFFKDIAKVHSEDFCNAIERLIADSKKQKV